MKRSQLDKKGNLTRSQIREIRTELLNLCMWYEGEMAHKVSEQKNSKFGKLEKEIYERVKGKKSEKNMKCYTDSFSYYYVLQKERTDVYKNIFKKNKELYKLILDALDCVGNLMKAEKTAEKGKVSGRLKKEAEKAENVLEKFEEYDSKKGDRMNLVIMCVPTPHMFYEIKYGLHGRIKKIK